MSDQPSAAATGAPPTMASMTDDPFLRTTPADFGMDDVLWCYRRKLLPVEWSRQREPSCEHTDPELREEQPASMCRICKDRQPLTEWERYWSDLKAEAARIRAQHEAASDAN